MGIALALGVTLLASILVLWNPLLKWQLKLTNRFYDRNEASEEIVIVGIGEISLDENIGLGRWQNWNRTYYAQVVENLEAAGVESITFDLSFDNTSSGLSENSLYAILENDLTYKDFFEEVSAFLGENHPEDQQFADTLAHYGNVILAKKFVIASDENEIESIPNIEILSKNSQAATAYAEKDEDEMLRRFPYEVWDVKADQFIETLAAKTYEMVSAPDEISNIKKKIGDNGTLLINYAAPPNSFRTIPFVDVYRGDFDAADLKDKIVFIGITSQWLEDKTITPTSPDTPMPGVEVWANALQTLLEENFLTEQSALSQIATIAVLVLVLTLALMFLGIIPGLILAMALIAGYHLAAEPIFDRGFILNLVYPTIALFAAYLSTTLYKYLTETREKKELKGAFSKYVNKDLVNQIMENPELLKLGGERRTVTVFFSDIESFTTFSEKSTPEQLVAQLNEYFDVMTSIVLQNGGTLDKFEGDAIMAFWGAPLDQKDHAILAAKSALECRVALQDLHARWQQAGKPLLNFRTGLATGEAIAGNIGSKDRFDYTVMGDIVNLGARLEGANKTYNTRIMMSDATVASLGDQFEVRHLDLLRVKGKEKSVEVYELLALKGQLTDAHRTIISRFHEGIEAYRKGEFDAALTIFKEVATLAPHDGPTQTYIERCTDLKQNPPAAWDGTWTLDHK